MFWAEKRWAHGSQRATKETHPPPGSALNRLKRRIWQPSRMHAAARLRRQGLEACRLLVQLVCNAEMECDASTCECLAIVWSVFLLCPYIEGSHFIRRTKHQELKWMMNLKEATKWLAQRRLQVMEFTIEVVCYLGLYHQATNALSELSQMCQEIQAIAQRSNLVFVVWYIWSRVSYNMDVRRGTVRTSSNIDVR